MQRPERPGEFHTLHPPFRGLPDGLWNLYPGVPVGHPGLRLHRPLRGLKTTIVPPAGVKVRIPHVACPTDLCGSRTSITTYPQLPRVLIRHLLLLESGPVHSDTPAFAESPFQHTSHVQLFGQSPGPSSGCYTTRAGSPPLAVCESFPYFGALRSEYVSVLSVFPFSLGAGANSTTKYFDSGRSLNEMALRRVR